VPEWQRKIADRSRSKDFANSIGEAQCHGQAVTEDAEYLNNRLEADHGPIKRLCRATLGFKSMKTAHATIKGFEVVRMIRKRQCIGLEPGVTAEVRFAAKLFGVRA
jgi:transposase, IS6 family